MDVTIPTNDVMALIGAAISLLFNFTPKLKNWFEAKSPKFKAGTMIAIAILAAGFGFVQGCVDGSAACEAVDLVALIEYLLTVITANQATHLLAKRFA